MAYFSKFYNGLRPIIFFCNHQERSLALGTIGMPAGLFCIVCWQDGINPYTISVFTHPPALERLCRAHCGYSCARVR